MVKSPEKTDLKINKTVGNNTKVNNVSVNVNASKPLVRKNVAVSPTKPDRKESPQVSKNIRTNVLVVSQNKQLQTSPTSVMGKPKFLARKTNTKTAIVGNQKNIESQHETTEVSEQFTIPKKKTVSKDFQKPSNNMITQQKRNNTMINDIKKADSKPRNNEVNVRREIEAEAANIAKARLIIYNDINVTTPVKNKLDTSNNEIVNLITPKQTIQNNTEVCENDIAGTDHDDGKQDTAETNGDVDDNNNGDDQYKDNGDAPDKESKDKPRIGNREMSGLKFSKDYGSEKHQMIETADKDQRLTRKKLQLNDNGTAHGKEIRLLLRVCKRYVLNVM